MTFPCSESSPSSLTLKSLHILPVACAFSHVSPSCCGLSFPPHSVPALFKEIFGGATRGRELMLSFLLGSPGLCISQMRKWRLRGSATEPASRAALMPTPRRVLSPHLRENRQLLGLVLSQPLLCLSDPLPSRPHTARPKVTPKPVWRLALWGSERSSETWALGLLPVRDVLLLQRGDVTSRGGQGNASKSGLVSEPTWKGARAAASLACEMEDVS